MSTLARANTHARQPGHIDPPEALPARHSAARANIIDAALATCSHDDRPQKTNH